MSALPIGQVDGLAWHQIAILVVVALFLAILIYEWHRDPRGRR